MKPCTRCGFYNTDGSKFCSNCGATFQKPLYKKWWFWMLLGIVSFILFYLFILFLTATLFGTTPSHHTVTAVSDYDAYYSRQQDYGGYPQEETVSVPAYMTIGEENALRSANSYLSFMCFSREGLIDQLEYEGFTTQEAEFAVDNCGADWFEQAVGCAESYLDSNSFSYEGLVDQLEYEGFTREQAVYGVDRCGADWYEQAVLTARSYRRWSDMSRADLIDQLEYEGFTFDQAVYGVDNCDY